MLFFRPSGAFLDSPPCPLPGCELLTACSLLILRAWPEFGSPRRLLSTVCVDLGPRGMSAPLNTGSSHVRDSPEQPAPPQAPAPASRARRSPRKRKDTYHFSCHWPTVKEPRSGKERPDPLQRLFLVPAPARPHFKCKSSLRKKIPTRGSSQPHVTPSEPLQSGRSGVKTWLPSQASLCSSRKRGASHFPNFKLF